MEYMLIEEQDQWPDVVRACDAVSVIAIDTEFMRFNTYYPMLGLVQIYTGKECFLIDPVAVGNLEPLKAILERADLLKVLHACSEDMEVFQHSLGTVPRPIFDTQIAGAMLGVGFSVGYQNLVEHYLSISLPKDQTRSDWLARPLTADQLEYAALDVIHLLEVYDKILEQLDGSPRRAWVLTESEAMGVDIPTLTPPDQCYLKVKGLWQFDASQLNLLKILFAWRETTARKDNVPRNRVADEKALVTIVKEGLNSRSEFQREAGMLPRQLRKYCDQILFLKAEAQQVPEAEFPAQMKRTDTPVSSKKLKKLRQVLAREAEHLNIAPELLTKRRHLEKLIRSEDAQGAYHLPDELKGWREDLIGKPLLVALAD
jgi:ribonuclease D